MGIEQLSIIKTLQESYGEALTGVELVSENDFSEAKTKIAELEKERDAAISEAKTLEKLYREAFFSDNKNGPPDIPEKEEPEKEYEEVSIDDLFTESESN